MRRLRSNKIVGNSNGASPVGTSPTTSPFSSSHLASIEWTKATARREVLGFGATLLEVWEYHPFYCVRASEVLSYTVVPTVLISNIERQNFFFLVFTKYNCSVYSIISFWISFCGKKEPTVVKCFLLQETNNWYNQILSYQMHIGVILGGNLAI